VNPRLKDCILSIQGRLVLEIHSYISMVLSMKGINEYALKAVNFHLKTVFIMRKPFIIFLLKNLARYLV